MFKPRLTKVKPSELGYYVILLKRSKWINADVCGAFFPGNICSFFVRLCNLDYNSALLSDLFPCKRHSCEYFFIKLTAIQMLTTTSLECNFLNWVKRVAQVRIHFCELSKMIVLQFSRPHISKSNFPLSSAAWTYNIGEWAFFAPYLLPVEIAAKSHK